MEFVADLFRNTVTRLTKDCGNLQISIDMIESGVFSKFLLSQVSSVLLRELPGVTYAEIAQVKLEPFSEDRRIIKLLLQGFCELMRAMILADRPLLTLIN